MKKSFFTILFLSSFLIAYSQDGVGPDYENFERYTQTNFSTPEVKAFEKVSLLPNNLSTGKLGLNIPIYIIKTGRLSYPISLSYNSGGVKVDDQASEVGLGWNLSKTIISRQIVDANDFDNVGTQFRDPAGGGFGNNLSDSEYAAHWDVFSYPNESRMGYFLKKAENQKADVSHKVLDEMPDLYSLIATDGFSTKFYFRDKQTPIELNEGSSIIDGDLVKRTFVNPQYNLDVNYPMYFPMYDFEKIEVTSNTGIKYTFEDYDVSITNSFELASSGSSYSRAGVLTVPQVSTWHISKIEDLLTGDKIEFEYETYNSDPVTAPFNPAWGWLGAGTPPPDALLISESIKTVPARTFITSNFNNCDPRYPRGSALYNDHKFVYKRRHYTRYYVKNRLINITFNGGRINFDWGANRLDQYNTKKLNSINIFSKEDGSASANKLINKFDFTFGYFDSGCSNSYKCKRLRLESIKEIGKPSYNFSYFGENSYFPEITSNKKDFLGFYNSAVTQPQGSFIVPHLYFYPNQQEYSILPFNVSGSTNYKIHGDYDDIPSLSDVKTWSLESITYPTGAVTELDYELNEINVFNQNVTVSGLRLASSTIKDENNVVRNINYSYVKEDGSSSGSLVNSPDYGRPTINFNSNAGSNISQWESKSLYDTFIINQYPKIDADISNGNYVTYSQAKEEEVNNGYSIYSFISNEIEPNEYNRTDPTQETVNLFTGGDLCEAVFAINNSAYGLNFYTDNSFKRGKLLNKKVFDVNNNPKHETINIYSENSSFETENFKKRFFRGKNKYVNDANDDFENMIEMTKAYKQNTSKLLSSKTIEYYYGENVENHEDFEYNDMGLLLSSTRYLSPQERYKTIYTYVGDSDVADTGIAQLQSINLIADVVKEETAHIDLVSNTSTSSFKKEYKVDGMIDQIYTKQKGNAYKKEYDFELYNNRGKPIQFRDKSGKVTSLFWYNDLLIARVENATYNSIKSHILSTDSFNIENCESGNCSNYFSESLRSSFENAQIYTYAYESSLENPISVTDPNNETFYYEYDDYGRLIKVTDKNGNILSTNEYNYRLPN